MQKLIKITHDFTFLDQIFAECFRAFEHAFNNDIVRDSLVQIRASLAKRQHRGLDSTSSIVYIGKLGEFCESVCASWEQAPPDRKPKGFKSALKYGSDCVIYLQDALEIPYWQLVIDLFLDWRESNTNNMLATAILHTLQYKAMSCQKKADELRRLQVAPQHKKDRKGLGVLLDGIQRRLDFLTDALELVMPPDEGMETEDYAIIATQVTHTESTPATKIRPPEPRNVRHLASPNRPRTWSTRVPRRMIPRLQGC